MNDIASPPRAGPQTTSETTPPVTRAELAYTRLRADILSGRLAPDTPLRLDGLRAAYGFSFSPLREALVRLQAERLVVLFEQRGFRVAPVDPAAMWDLIEGRILLETAALRDSVAHLNAAGAGAIRDGLAGLGVAAARLSGASPARQGAEMEALRTAHRGFHLALLSRCRSRRLFDLAQQLMIEAERYRAPELAAALAAGQGGGAVWAGQGARDAMAEHEALAQAVLAREADRAVDLLAVHYRRTGEAVARAGRDSMGPDDASGDAPDDASDDTGALPPHPRDI